MASRSQQVAKVAAGVLGVAGCIPMIAMLPGGVVAALGALGIHATTGPFAPVARALAPVARPLLVVATVALVVAGVRCGRGVAVLAAVGGALLYMSMYVLPVGAAMAGMTAPAVNPTAARAGAVGATNEPIFYLGLAAFLGTFIWSAFRRHRARCRPALRRYA